jgi:hypothetical protein
VLNCGHAKDPTACPSGVDRHDVQVFGTNPASRRQVGKDDIATSCRSACYPTSWPRVVAISPSMCRRMTSGSSSPNKGLNGRSSTVWAECTTAVRRQQRWCASSSSNSSSAIAWKRMNLTCRQWRLCEPQRSSPTRSRSSPITLYPDSSRRGRTSRWHLCALDGAVRNVMRQLEVRYVG